MTDVVRGAREQLEIFYSIIVLDTIDVMNHFLRLKHPPNRLGH